MKSSHVVASDKVRTHVANMETPFDAFALSKAADISVMSACMALTTLAQERVVSALNEFPEGEPFHVSERYVSV